MTFSSISEGFQNHRRNLAVKNEGGGGGAKSTMVIWNSDACILRPVKCRVFTSFAIFTLHNRFEDISVLLFANIKLSNHKKFLCRKNIGNGGICPTLNPPPPKLRLCS